MIAQETTPLSYLRQLPRGQDLRSIGLVFIALITFLLLLNKSVAIGVDRGSTDRVVFHAVPVALAVLHHDLPHDYTSRKSIAFQFQSPGKTLDQKIEQSVLTDVSENDEKYFWAADDRGMADYVLAAFLIFGAEEASLHKLYFLIMFLSLTAYFIVFFRSPYLLVFAILVLIGIGSYITIFPALDETLFFRVIEPSELRAIPVGIFEPRALDALTTIACFHLIFQSCVGRKLTVLSVAILLFQSMIIILGIHARSSLGWQVVGLGVVTVIFVLIGSPFTARGSNGVKTYRNLKVLAFMPIVVVIIGILILTAYKQHAYDPSYQAEQGRRTFWHNALMGLSSSEDLKVAYKLAVADKHIVEAVTKHTKETLKIDLDRSWDSSQNILNSLGGHSFFDWETYDGYAREMYFHLWFNHTTEVIRTYLIVKPTESLGVLWKFVSLNYNDRFDHVGFNPFALHHFLLGFLAILIGVSDLRRVETLLAINTIFTFVSLIPSVAFYAAPLTMAGFFVGVSLTCYLFVWYLLTFACFKIRGRA